MKIHRGQIVVLMMALVLLLMQGTAALAEDDGIQWVEIHYPGSAETKLYTCSFPYSDDYFRGEDSVYNHRLAQLSIGMAAASSRNILRPADEQDAELRAFLTNCGCTELVSADYDRPTSATTISTVIGQKQIDDFTLIVVGVCSAQYGKEWISNFQVGTGVRAEGFNNAAQRVEARIYDYLDAHQLEGKKIKLWIAGHSRPGQYDNIFNIIGKFDPVPLVPLKEWGYQHIGVTLYNPAQETDSDYMVRWEKANAVYQRVRGTEFNSSVEYNQTFHKVFEFLLGIVPTNAVYADHLQGIIQQVWGNYTLPNITSTLMQLLQDDTLITEENRDDAESLLDYLSTVIFTLMQWNQGQTVTGKASEEAYNLVFEHDMNTYIAWALSTDDPTELYTDKNEYIRMVITGDVDVMLETTEYGYLGSVDTNGNPYTEEDMLTRSIEVALVSDDMAQLDMDAKPRINVIRKGNQTIVTLPRDRDYLVMMKLPSGVTEDREVSYYAEEYTIDSIMPTIRQLHVETVTKDTLGVFWTQAEELPEEFNSPGRTLATALENIEVQAEDNQWAVKLLSKAENSNLSHLTIRQIFWMAVAAAVLVILLLILVIVLIVRAVRRRRKIYPQGKQKNQHLN